MPIVTSIPEVEAWLEADAADWSMLTDSEYKSVVDRWKSSFGLRVTHPGQLHGHRAIASIETRLPAGVLLISGVRVPRLANMGGTRTTGYQAEGLRSIRRDVANHHELIAVATDFTWSCVFSHEADSMVWEELFEAS